MDGLRAWVEWAIGFWPTFIAILALLGGWVRFGRRFHSRLLRSLAFSDGLHERFGETAAASLSAILHESCVDAAVRECRIQIIEEMFGLAVYICDVHSGEWIKANRKLGELFGMDTQDMLGSGWLGALDPAEKIKVWEHQQKCIKKHLPYEQEYNITHRQTGERYRCRTVATAARLKSGESVWYVGIVERMDE